MKHLTKQAKTTAFVLGLFLSCTALTSAQPLETTHSERAVKVMQQLHAQSISLEQAFAQGQLDKQTLLFIVGDDKLPDPKHSLWDTGPMGYRLTGFLLEKFPEVLTEIDQQTSEVRIRVGLYLQSKKDERGAAIMEKIIAEQPFKQPDSKILLSALYNLSNFYQRIGQPLKGYETAVRVKEYNLTPEAQSNILLTAARALSAAGEKENALVAYEEVRDLGYGWATGHAYVDMARLLTQDGKKEEARALLKTPITGANSDMGMVLTKSSLMQSYYKDGNWEQTRIWGQATIDQYENSSKSVRGLEWAANSAKSTLESIKQWEKSPISMYAEKIEIALRNPIPNNYYIHLSANSYKAFTLQVTPSAPGIELLPLLSPEGYSHPSSQQFAVQIDAKLLQGDTKHKLVFTSLEFPDWKKEISISARPEPKANSQD